MGREHDVLQLDQRARQIGIGLSLPQVQGGAGDLVRPQGFDQVIRLHDRGAGDVDQEALRAEGTQHAAIDDPACGGAARTAKYEEVRPAGEFGDRRDVAVAHILALRARLHLLRFGDVVLDAAPAR